MSYNLEGRIFVAGLLADRPEPLSDLFARENAREQADAQAAETQRITNENTTREFINQLTHNDTKDN